MGALLALLSDWSVGGAGVGGGVVWVRDPASWCVADVARSQELVAKPGSSRAKLLARILGRQSSARRCREPEVKVRAGLGLACIPAASRHRRARGPVRRGT